MVYPPTEDGHLPSNNAAVHGRVRQESNLQHVDDESNALTTTPHH